MPPSSDHRAYRSLGLWIPLILALALTADMASRFVSYDHVAFRGWEALSRGFPNGLGGKFIANRRYVSDRTSGDLAAMGNYPSLRQYRREVFTTDEFGMRNQPRLGGKRWVGALAGTSFSIGSTVNDDEILNVRLGELLNVPIYNAAGMEVGSERQVGRLVRRLGLSGGFLIVDITDGVPPPTPSDLKPEPEDALPHGWEARVGPYGDEVQSLRNYLKAWLAETPFTLTLYQGFKRVQNDVILPNRFAINVVRDELANGDPILFARFQVGARFPSSAVHDAAAFCQGLARMLGHYRVELLVVLIPSQYRVYGPLVKHPRQDLASVGFLEDLEGELRGAGISVVNLTPVLMAAARDGLADHRYVYFRDDTHWNAEGITVGARTLAPVVRRMIAVREAGIGGSASPRP